MGASAAAPNAGRSVSRVAKRPGTDRLSASQARRIALAAQGFAKRRPRAVTARAIAATFDRLGVVQIDSVNVLVRSHYLPLFSRLGAYDPARLERLAYDPRERQLFEYWGHEASLLPLALHPLFRWRMARAERFEAGWQHVREIGRARGGFVDAVRQQIAERGPLAAGEIVGGGKSDGPWWGWSDGKRALEWLFWSGQIATAYRRGFERVYDLTERVIPSAILALPTPAEADAQRELVRIAARAHGIATEADLRDYFRLSAAEAKARVAELVEAGELTPVAVEGWKPLAYLSPTAKVPSKIDACALLSPFDSLVWERSRTERLFDFSYRLEIYTPAPKRVHGYYVLPFLCGDRLVARVDLKAVRAEGVLEVRGVHDEIEADRAAVMPALATELRALARWLELDDVRIVARTAAARSLRAPLRRT
jgi:uncharacterized protein YcaQ